MIHIIVYTIQNSIFHHPKTRTVQLMIQLRNAADDTIRLVSTGQAAKALLGNTLRSWANHNLTPGW